MIPARTVIAPTGDDANEINADDGPPVTASGPRTADNGIADLLAEDFDDDDDDAVSSDGPVSIESLHDGDGDGENDFVVGCCWKPSTAMDVNENDDDDDIITATTRGTTKCLMIIIIIRSNVTVRLPPVATIIDTFFVFILGHG
jgi:hypothetical protein